MRGPSLRTCLGSLWPGTRRTSDCTSSLGASVDAALPSLFPGSRPLRAGFAADWDQHDGIAWRPPPGLHPSAGSAVSPISSGEACSIWPLAEVQLQDLKVAGGPTSLYTVLERTLKALGMLC